jgi:hypothetical protein
VLIPSLMEPVYVLFGNLGYSREETVFNFLRPLLGAMSNNDFALNLLPPVRRKWYHLLGNKKYQHRELKESLVYDALEGTYVEAITGGILDSTPAVLEAIRNSLSIASLLGTLGGCVVFNRDTEVERQEARDTNEFLRTAHINEANERA